MAVKDLATIQTVPIRQVFQRESTDFTPWLNENISLLNDTLGIDIVDNTIEEKIGNFSCDIVGRESGTGKVVVIENQFGETDHNHLGKLLTYAAGMNAGIVIWIAESFKEDHKRVLEWLNENVDPESQILFFGVELRIIQIENSTPALDLRVIVKPNDWERSVKMTSKIRRESRIEYLKFFEKLVNAYKKANTKWRPVKPQPQQWLYFSGGKSGLKFGWVFRSNNRFSVELYIDTRDKEKNNAIFDYLFRHKNEIEHAIGLPISRERLEEKRASRITIYKAFDKPFRSLSVDEQ